MYIASADCEANMLTFFLNHAIWAEMQMYSCIRIHSEDYSKFHQVYIFSYPKANPYSKTNVRTPVMNNENASDTK